MSSPSRVPNVDRFQSLIFLALTTIFVGYFMVWLPNEAAGLSFIGLELGEEAKFLAQVRRGDIVAGRSLFYVPPVTLAIILALLTTPWPKDRWQTWVMRAFSILLSVLAFPALEALNMAPGWQSEWLWRLLMISLVVAVAVFVSLAGQRIPRRLQLTLIILTALAGAGLPTWAYLEVRQAFAALLPDSVGVGPGMWLNLGGHLAAALFAAGKWREAA